MTANLVPDAQLTAVALWLGIPLVSTHTAFARFSEIPLITPLAES